MEVHGFGYTDTAVLGVDVEVWHRSLMHPDPATARVGMEHCGTGTLQETGVTSHIPLLWMSIMGAV